jgi:hypothetical protein
MIKEMSFSALGEVRIGVLLQQGLIDSPVVQQSVTMAALSLASNLALTGLSSLR